MRKKNQRNRIREIVSVFIKYGMKDGIKNISNPAQIRKAIEELGPTFVKIGQILSTRPDIVPEAYANEFQKLQDNVKAESFDDIREIIETQLNGPMAKFFKHFDEHPIASASIAQVHMAVLHTGEQVVVKIQRPKINETLQSDVAILRKLAHIMKFTPQGSVINPIEVVDILWESVKKELDFLNEAENVHKFYENNKDISYITCPKIYTQYTRSNILVMEYIDGIKIGNKQLLLNNGYNLKDLALKITNNYFKQVFEDGFFHADPHPGNILVYRDKIAYIDFGLMGTLTKNMQSRFNDFIYGIATKNLDIITRTILKIGIKKGVIDSRKLYSDVEQIYNNYVDIALQDIDLPALLDELFKVMRRNNIGVPNDITMLMKGTITIEAVVESLDPEVNIMDLAVPYVKKQIFKKKNIKQDIIEQLDTVYTLSRSGLKIPIKLLELINSALAGKLKIQMEHTNLDKSINELNRMTNRVVIGLIISSLIIGSSQVINSNTGPKINNVSAFGFIGYIGAAVMGIWLIISILRSGKI